MFESLEQPVGSQRSRIPGYQNSYTLNDMNTTNQIIPNDSQTIPEACSSQTPLEFPLGKYDSAVAYCN